MSLWDLETVKVSLKGPKVKVHHVGSLGRWDWSFRSCFVGKCFSCKVDHRAPCRVPACHPMQPTAVDVRWVLSYRILTSTPSTTAMTSWLQLPFVFSRLVFLYFPAITNSQLATILQTASLVSLQSEFPVNLSESRLSLTRNE